MKPDVCWCVWQTDSHITGTRYGFSCLCGLSSDASSRWLLSIKPLSLFLFSISSNPKKGVCGCVGYIFPECGCALHTISHRDASIIGVEKEPHCVSRATWITEDFLIVTHKHNRKGQVGRTPPSNFILWPNGIVITTFLLSTDIKKKRTNPFDIKPNLQMIQMLNKKKMLQERRRRQFAWFWRTRMGFMRLSVTNKTFCTAFRIWHMTDRFMALWKTIVCG